MKRTVVISAAILCVIIVFGYLAFFIGARTMYRGSVGIEPLPLTDIADRLSAQGCRSPERPVENPSLCFYELQTTARGTGLEVYPRGPGFGPVSFFVTEDALYATKDIEGLPFPSRFKREVRADVERLGNFVVLREDSWNLTDVDYPVKFIY